jgi:hypothetical protein
VRRLAGAEGRDRGDHRLGIGAAEARLDAILVLRRVEVGGDLLEHAAQRLGQAVPELDLDRLLRRYGHCGPGKAERDSASHDATAEHVAFLSPSVGWPRAGIRLALPPLYKNMTEE